MATTELNVAQHDLDWTHARHLPKERKKWLPTKNIFKGSSTLEKSSFNGIELTRISVRPIPEKIQPASLAVINPLSWERETSEKLPLNLQWTQALDSRWEFAFDMPEEMKCLGLGERFSGLDLRGGTHTLCATDNPEHDEAMDSMYISIPLLILAKGKENYALFLDSPAPQRWHLDPDFEEKGHIELFSRRGWQMYLIGPASLPDIVKTYTHLTGRAALPPRWALLAIFNVVGVILMKPPCAPLLLSAGTIRFQATPLFLILITWMNTECSPRTKNAFQI
jgi:hypothetical protein